MEGRLFGRKMRCVYVVGFPPLSSGHFAELKLKLSRNDMPANEAFQALHHTIARLPSQGIQLHILCEVIS